MSASGIMTHSAIEVTANEPIWGEDVGTLEEL